jgi:hypothetical protein
LINSVPLAGSGAVHNIWMPDAERNAHYYHEPPDIAVATNITHVSDLPELLPQLFISPAGGNALEQFAYTAGLGDIASVDTSFFQWGSLAYILLSRIRDIKGQEEWAVTNLARGNYQTQEGVATFVDASALNDIASRFAANVKPEYLRKMHPVAPYSSGAIDHPSGDPRLATPFYMTPFIGRSEAHIYGQIIVDGNWPFTMPYWGNAIKWDPTREQDDNAAVNAAKKYYLQTQEDPRNAKYPWPDPTTLFDFWALVYLLSEGRIPSGHNPDAGDFITNPTERSFTAITMRGGWMYRMSPAAAAARLAGIKVDMLTGPDDTHKGYHPYAGMAPEYPGLVPSAWRINTRELFEQRLEKVAKHCLVKGSRFAQL